MAKTKNVLVTPRRPGYKTEDILDPIPDEPICNICTEVYTDPASCCSEGHDRCNDCLAEWVREKGTCPVCREKVGVVGKKITKNRLGCAMVANLAVRCPEHAAGGAGGAGAGASAAGAGCGSAAVGGSSGGGRSGDNARSDSTTIGT